MDVAAWLGVNLRFACVEHPAAGPAFAASVLRVHYPALIASGRRLLPCTVFDLAVWYCFPSGLHCRRPAGKWGLTEAEGIGRFCDLLNGAYDQAALWRLIERVRRFRRGCAPSAADPAAVAGLGCFLDMAATALPPGADLKLLRDVLAAWPTDISARRLTDVREDTSSRSLASAFYRSCASDDRLCTLSEPALEQQMMMPLASAMYPGGHLAIDLACLQGCFDYKPVAGGEPGAGRIPARSVRPRFDQDSRTAEFGNHGITQKGPITAVLRSYLAKDDFFERLYRGDLLYFQRFAPKRRPLRVLAAFILERTGSSRAVNAYGMRTESVAFELAASLMEDFLRAAAALPEIDARAVAVAHNNLAGERFTLTSMPVGEFEQASFAALGNETLNGRVPGLTAFFPDYFLSEPAWKPRGAVPHSASEQHDAVSRALIMLRQQAMTLSEEKSDFDLVCVTLFCATVPHRPEELLRIVSPIGKSLAMHICSCESHFFDWRMAPTGKSRKRISERKPYDTDSFMNIREAYLKDLSQRLAGL